MKQLLDIINSEGFNSLSDGDVSLTDGGSGIYLAVDPVLLQIAVAAGGAPTIILLYRQAVESSVVVKLEQGGVANILQIFVEGNACVNLTIEQQRDSRSVLNSIQLASSTNKVRTTFYDKGAEATTDALFLIGEAERSLLDLRTEHLTPNCQSNTLIKGVASGDAKGEFSGMVYVAPGAQQTNANQLSRNMELSQGACIITRPELEIYADDVKCTHGATVGQVDDEAIYYMLQRGLSQSAAKALLIEGFVGEVIDRTSLEALREPLMDAVRHKLERI